MNIYSVFMYIYAVYAKKCICIEIFIYNIFDILIFIFNFAMRKYTYFNRYILIKFNNFNILHYGKIL